MGSSYQSFSKAAGSLLAQNNFDVLQGVCEWVISFYLLSIYAPEKACYMILPLNKMAAILQVTFSNAFLYE